MTNRRNTDVARAVSDVSFVYRHCDLAPFGWDVCWRNHCLDVETAPTPETSASFCRVHQRPDKQQLAGFVIANRVQERVIQSQVELRGLNGRDDCPNGCHGRGNRARLVDFDPGFVQYTVYTGSAVR
jgi:hypothetical protein